MANLEIRRVGKNTLFVLLSQTIPLLSNVVLYVLVGRYLGPGGLGRLSFLFAYIGLFGFLPDLGASLYLIREIARNPDAIRGKLDAAFGLTILLAPLTYVLVISASFLLDLPFETQSMVFLGGAYLIMGAGILLFRSAYHAHERMELETYVTAFERLLILLTCATALVLGADVLTLIAIYTAVRLISLLLSAYLFRREIAPLPRVSGDWRVILSLAKESSPFAANILTTTIYIQADIVLLALWLGDEPTGYYRAATGLIIPLAIIATSFNSALFPSMARAFLQGTSKVKRLVQRSAQYLLVIATPISVIIFLEAPRIVSALYGSNFQESALPLRILSLIIPMRFLNNSLAVGLTAIDRQGYRAGVIMACAVLNLALNVILIPSISYVGASIATLITEVAILLSLYYFLRRTMGGLRIGEPMIKAFFCGLIMAILIQFTIGIGIYLAVVLSLLLYVGCLFALRVLRCQEVLSIAKGILSNVVDRPF